MKSRQALRGAFVAIFVLLANWLPRFVTDCRVACYFFFSSGCSRSLKR
jgi:hypothetical protein